MWIAQFYLTETHSGKMLCLPVVADVWRDDNHDRLVFEPGVTIPNGTVDDERCKLHAHLHRHG